MSGAMLALAVKEIRAAWPVWFLSVIALTLPGLVRLVSGRLPGLEILGYVVGGAVLGGQVIGREYTNRTLASLLVQPISRRRLLLVKLTVLGAMLASLAVVADVMVLAAARERAGLSRHPEMTALLWTPLLSAFFLAPWLTMVCRNALAGAVFSLVLPGLVQVVAALASAEAEPFSVRTFWTGCLALCAIGAFMTWRTFERLELVDGFEAFSLPRWTGLRGSARSSPGPRVWVLIKKEVRLQQMAFVVAAGYLLTCLALILGWPRVADDAVSAMSFMYAVSIPPLVGSVASAEERQLGTLDWQLLLPVATWKQWAVKVAVALVISMVLSLGLPTLLLGIDLDRRMAAFAIPVVLLTVCSLYLSSLFSSGIWAFLATLAVGVASAPVVERLLRRTVVDGSLLLPQSTAAGLVIGGAFLIAVLGCGLINHRSTERSVWSVGRQLVALGGCLAIAIASWFVLTTRTGILQ